MEVLSNKGHWNVIHKVEGKSRKFHFPPKNLKGIIKSFLGKEALNYFRSYENYLLWDVIYKQYMPKTEGAKVLEVGSAPGEFLVQLNKTFGFVPYGVEYSEIGVELNKEEFANNNIDPNNVIHADFFSNEFHSRYKGYFDIVISRGFIEHFTDVENLIDKHLNLLKKGGHLIVSIPNLRGINYFLSWFFNKEVIAIHNLDIMEKDRFSKLFQKENLSPLFCDYYGTFDLTLFNTKEHSPMRHLLAISRKLQLGLNVGFRLFLKDRGAENRMISPHLIYIGVNKE
jgi:2-polyprenyl-3-methyl-5-hydroxy-6-metoxy-1,4-benzoquinol methylase